MSKTKIPKLKTKNLYLIPKTLEELKTALKEETDAEMKKAYQDMIEGVEQYPSDWLWYTDWNILQISDKSLVGDICMKGTVNDLGEVEIGYGIDEKYRRKGYGLEAVNAIMEWILKNENVYYITAETEPDNIASQGLLQKAGFLPTGMMGDEGPRYEKERPGVSYLSLYMCLGISVGMCFGMSVLNNTALGMCFGIGIGCAIGSSLDQKNKKFLDELKQKRKEAYKQQS